MLLHRYGDYANARTLYAQLLDDTERRRRSQARGPVQPGPRLSRRRALRRGACYARRPGYGAGGDGADPNQFAKKEQFLRGEALLGQGSYSEAIAAYWRFLDAYPWMGESVQPRIAAAYLALNDPASAAAAFRRAAEVSSDNVSKARLLEQVRRRPCRRRPVRRGGRGL